MSEFSGSGYVYYKSDVIEINKKLNGLARPKKANHTNNKYTCKCSKWADVKVYYFLFSDLNVIFIYNLNSVNSTKKKNYWNKKSFWNNVIVKP